MQPDSRHLVLFLAAPNIFLAVRKLGIYRSEGHEHAVTERAAVLREPGIYAGILHKDITGVNTRLTKDYRAFGHGMLVPFGSINPKFPDCQEDVPHCHEDHKMPTTR